MRLKPEKIRQLATVIHNSLAARKEIDITESREHVIGLIGAVITEDLRTEDEIEEEARKLIDLHSVEVDRLGASYEKLVQKAKQKIARERKMVL